MTTTPQPQQPPCEPSVVIQKGCMRIDSNNNVPCSILTDSGQGIVFKSDGTCYFRTGTTSTEVVGQDIQFGNNIPAKFIHAENGNIVLSAPKGTVEIVAANIKLVSTNPLGGQIVIDSTGTIQITSPSTKVQGENFNVAMTQGASIGGGKMETNGVIANNQTTATDEVKASFFGQILSGIRRFSNFFNSLCGE